jgi:hypothetical protein
MNDLDRERRRTKRECLFCESQDVRCAFAAERDVIWPLNERTANRRRNNGRKQKNHHLLAPIVRQWRMNEWVMQSCRVLREILLRSFFLTSRGQTAFVLLLGLSHLSRKLTILYSFEAYFFPESILVLHTPLRFVVTLLTRAALSSLPLDHDQRHIHDHSYSQ